MMIIIISIKITEQLIMNNEGFCCPILTLAEGSCEVFLVYIHVVDP